MPLIYVDLDDVLSKTTCHYVKIMGKEFNRSVKFEDIHSFDLRTSFGLSRKEYDHFFRIVHQPDVILELEPMEDSIEVLNKWVGMGLEISVITGRLTSCYEASLEWLNKKRVPFKSFLIVNKYSRPHFDKRKSISLEELTRLKFLFAVEDSLEIARHISAEMLIPVALFDRPWNQSNGLSGRIKRYDNWKEIEEMGERFLL